MKSRSRILASSVISAWALVFVFSGCAQNENDNNTYFTPESIKIIDDLKYVKVNGEKFFALGFDAHSGPVYDGVTTTGCDEDKMVGYLDIQVEKVKSAAASGANFAYVWSYGKYSDTLVATSPQLYGIYPGDYKVGRDASKDVIPIIYNAFGESDMGGYSQAKVDSMAAEFKDFIKRQGKYSIENMPNLPPVSQVGHMSWHPTWRMIGTGDGTGEMLTSTQAANFAKTTNMSIGADYTYVENRFDMSDPEERLVGLLAGQKGDKGQGYEYWLSIDDPDHRSYFSPAWDLANSMRTKSDPEAVVWLWIQGYSFGKGIQESLCKGTANDSWATGGFPSKKYLRKEIMSLIAAGGTGFVFFGFFDNDMENTKILNGFFKALSSAEIYKPVLLSPKLDLGVDFKNYGEGGRAHLIVKWDAEGKKAYIAGANPGAKATAFSVDFPWTIDKAELFDFDVPSFNASSELVLLDKRLSYVAPIDEGFIIRVTPKMK